MKKYMVMAVFAMIAIMALGMLNTGAWFTDQAATPLETVHSGILSINNGEFTQIDLGTLTNWAPGDLSESVSIKIENNGTLPLVWVGDLVVEGDSLLKEVVYIDDAQMEFSWGEDTDHFITNGIDTDIYAGGYSEMEDPYLGVITIANFDGTSAMGVQPYEFTGALMPGEYYTLTLRFGFAELAGNAYQDLGDLKLGFAVEATQFNVEAMQALHAPMVNNNGFYGTQLANQDYIAP